MSRHDPNIDILDTQFVGLLTISYDALVAACGEPSTEVDHKTDVEWRIRLPSGKTVAIYNYKDGPIYCGAEGTPVPELTEWHVGGKDASVYAELRDWLRGPL